MSAPYRALYPALVVAAACQCEGRQLTRVREDFRIVEGTPQVDTARPAIQKEDLPNAPSFKLSVPRQCDFFTQLAQPKVDILFVVDNSGSMFQEQANLAANFSGFINQLQSIQPPIDFHIGVTSTDTDNDALLFSSADGTPPPDRNGTRGSLHGWSSSGKSGSFIACDVNKNCNAPDVGQAFAQMSKVGTGGSAVERGLYAAVLALNLAANTQGASPFIRKDAALYVIFVSDEDDSSCSPFVPAQTNGTTTFTPCYADPGCKCDAANLTYGATGYFTRFFEGYKGYGNANVVGAAAVVCTSNAQVVPAQFGDPNEHRGCPDRGTGVSYYGGRYVQVANDTGGSTADISSGNFSGALTSLGFAVSGLRRDFRLSRAPLRDTLEVYLTPVNARPCAKDADCSATQRCRANLCAGAVTLASKADTCTGATDAAEYCRCDASAYRNIVRFNGIAVPPPQSTIEVCYDVNVNASFVCQ